MTRPRAIARSKRCFDLMFAAAALTLCAPLMLCIAAIVRLTLSKPTLFRQQRPGLGGIPFTLYKFRTMRGAPSEIQSDHDRISRFGAFLRRASLDELPELWNVIRGEMSLVGPRPLLMQYLDRYSPEQSRRHEVMPGLTGWAQIHGRNATSWNERLALDVWYIEHQSFSLDLGILWRTLIQMLGGRGVNHSEEVTMPEFMGTRESEANTVSR